EHLAPDGRVQSEQLNAWEGAQALDRARRRAAGDAEAELAVLLAGHHVLVGVGLDPGRDPKEHEGVGADALQSIDLVERVDDDATDADLESADELSLRLVVAVQHQSLGGYAGGQRHV